MQFHGDQGRDRAFYEQVAMAFLAELKNGQRGVYRRLDQRFGTPRGVARWRVQRAVELGLLQWVGTRYEPEAVRPGSLPGLSDFERGFMYVGRYVEVAGHARVPSYLARPERVPDRFVGPQSAPPLRSRNLTSERVERLEALPGWVWRSPRGRVPNPNAGQG